MTLVAAVQATAAPSNPLPGTDADPTAIVHYLITSRSGNDLGTPHSAAMRRLLAASLLEKWKRSALVAEWTNEMDLGNEWITGQMDFTPRSWTVTSSSPSDVAAVFIGEDGFRAKVAFRFVREGGAWKVADAVYQDGSTSAVKTLDEMNRAPLPGRVLPSSFMVDLKKGSLGDEMGTTFEHNGSQMLVFERAGVIVYERPKRATAGKIKPNDVLFKGRFLEGRVEGIAYTFKNGCSPAPYKVEGSYQMKGSGGPNEIVLRGAAPIADPKSCAILGYSTRSANARLVFTFQAGDI